MNTVSSTPRAFSSSSRSSLRYLVRNLVALAAITGSLSYPVFIVLRDDRGGVESSGIQASVRDRLSDLDLVERNSGKMPPQQSIDGTVHNGAGLSGSGFQEGSHDMNRQTGNDSHSPHRGDVTFQPDQASYDDSPLSVLARIESDQHGIDAVDQSRYTERVGDEYESLEVLFSELEATLDLKIVRFNGFLDLRKDAISAYDSRDFSPLLVVSALRISPELSRDERFLAFQKRFEQKYLQMCERLLRCYDTSVHQTLRTQIKQFLVNLAGFGMFTGPQQENLYQRILRLFPVDAVTTMIRDLNTELHQPSANWSRIRDLLTGLTSNELLDFTDLDALVGVYVRALELLNPEVAEKDPESLQFFKAEVANAFYVFHRELASRDSRIIAVHPQVDAMFDFYRSLRLKSFVDAAFNELGGISDASQRSIALRTSRDMMALYLSSAAVQKRTDYTDVLRRVTGLFQEALSQYAQAGLARDVEQMAGLMSQVVALPQNENWLAEFLDLQENQFCSSEIVFTLMVLERAYIQLPSLQKSQLLPRLSSLLSRALQELPQEGPQRVSVQTMMERLPRL